MPTYSYRCERCSGGFQQWLSIHTPKDEHPQTHPGCGGKVVLSIERVNTYAVGVRGAETVEVDAREARWDRDRPAYKRLRADGLQPPSVIGSADLESHATDDQYVRTGGKFSIPDHRKDEIKEMLAGGAMSDWSPVDQVKKNKADA